jgi:hypothetical protein
VRNAQSAALRGQPTGALVQDDDRLFLVVAVPVRDGDRVSGAVTAGYRLTDDIARDLANLARCEVALVVNGRVVATSLRERMGASAEPLVVATMAAPGVRPDVLDVGGREYVAGVFPLSPELPGGDAVRLLVLSGLGRHAAVRGRSRSRSSPAWRWWSLVGGVFLKPSPERLLRDIATAATGSPPHPISAAARARVMPRPPRWPRRSTP